MKNDGMREKYEPQDLGKESTFLRRLFEEIMWDWYPLV